jgi:hypothetical protein
MSGHSGYISKCSAGSVVFLQAYSFLSGQVQSTVLGPWKWSTFIAVASFWVGEAPAQTNEKILLSGQNIVDHILSIPKHYNMSKFGQVLTV